MPTYTVSQGDYVANREAYLQFIRDMLTGAPMPKGAEKYDSRGIAGPNGTGFSSYAQIYADLAANGVDVSSLPSPATVASRPDVYHGVNAAGLPNSVAPVDPAQPTVPIPTAASGGDAQARVRDMLTSWGLGSLTDFAWGLLTGGATDPEVHYALTQRQEYKDRFKGMELRKANGLNAISEADYLSLEDSYRQAAQANGLLPGSYDAATAIGNDVAPNEFNNRAQLAAREIFNEPPQVQAVMLDYYGLQPGQIASYYLKPENALPKLQQMLYAGEIGGEASQLGYGLSRQAAESVALAGFTGDTARPGLAQVAAKSQLFEESIADRGQNLTPETGVLAQFGISADAIKAVQDRAQRRAAIAQAGTGGIVTQGGVLGASIAK